MRKLFSLLLGACTVFAACTDDVENIRQDGSAQLAVNVKVKPTSRAMVHGTALPGGSSIGINVTDANGNPYDGKDAGYLNVQYTATGEAGAQEWGATTPVLLSGTEGKMHAYYPWTTGIDYKAVAVDVANQTDWMYAADTYTVSDAKNAHEIVLSHAQTAVNVNLVRDASYTGVGAVEALTVTSEGLASTATLDTRDGSFASVTGANTDISIIEAPYTLDGTTLSSQENPYMLIPASTETKDFTVSATLDGKEYSHKVTMAEPFAPGKVYKINVTFKNTGLEVSTVTLVDWDEISLPEVEFKPGQEEVNPYPDYIRITYDVTTTNSQTKIFSDYVENLSPTSLLDEESRSSGSPRFDIRNISEILYVNNGEVVNIQPAYYYKFPKTGKQTLYVKLTDMTQIPLGMFSYCETVHGVEIPGSIISINESAFINCSLHELVLNEGLEYIGGYSFVGCNNIVQFRFPNSLEEIGYYAFGGCNALQEIICGTNLTVINGFAFEGCDRLQKITFKSSVLPDMGEYVFKDTSENKIYFVKSGIEIGDEWNRVDVDNYVCIDGIYYSKDKKILYLAEKDIVGDISIYNGVEKIRNKAFQYCSKITSVSIPNSVTSIGEYAFNGCSELTEASIAKGTQPIENSGMVIGDYAFYSCKALSFVSFGDNVQEIGYRAFYNCSGLTGTLTIPNSVTSLGEYAFYNCTGLKSVIFGTSLQAIGACAFLYCSGLTSITIPNSVTSIGASAFSGCSGLTEITIGSGMQSIGKNAFESCNNLEKIKISATVAPSIEVRTFYKIATGGLLYVPAGATGYDKWMQNDSHYLGYYNWKYLQEDAYTVVEGIIYSSDMKTLIECPADKTGIVNIPNSVTQIDRSAFSLCTGLTEVNIPNSVTSIGRSAFSGCKGLTEVIIPESVTSIGDYAFSGCNNLGKITSRATSAPTIQENTFYNIKEGGIFVVQKGCIDTYSNWMSTALYYLGLYKWKCMEEGYTIENGVYYSADGKTVYSNDGTVSGDVVIKDGVEYISKKSFENCTGITSVSIPNSVIEIGEDAFYNCTGLTAVTIGSGVTSIGGYAFKGCKGLTEVNIPNSVNSIGNSAFASCSGLTEITIGSGVQTIGNYAFNYCEKLSSITSYAMTAPVIFNNTFYFVEYAGTLYVPYGATGYDVWMSTSNYYLGYESWTMQEITE